MEELYSIMRDLLEVEYNQKTLLYVLKLIEASYSEEQQDEARLVANHTKCCIRALQVQLRTAINNIDSYIAAGAAQK